MLKEKIMDTKSIIALCFCFLIGVLCRFTRIPLPAPPSLMGSAMVMSITLGYLMGKAFAQ